MKVYLVMEVNDMTMHEQIEVWATEELAVARVKELNEQNFEEVNWVYDEREVKQ